jgi:hypothetical protein
MCDRRQAHKYLAHIQSRKDRHGEKDNRDTNEIFE